MVNKKGILNDIGRNLRYGILWNFSEVWKKKGGISRRRMVETCLNVIPRIS